MNTLIIAVLTVLASAVVAGTIISARCEERREIEREWRRDHA